MLHIISYGIARLNKLVDFYIWLEVDYDIIMYMDIIPLESKFFMILKHTYIDKRSLLHMN